MFHTYRLFVIFLTAIGLMLSFPAFSQTGIQADFSEGRGPLDHFWQSTGFTPAELLLSRPQRQQMTFAGAVPHHGITHVRIHYLLDLVEGEGFGTDEAEYDWSRLDKVLDVLVENDLKPFFELMGNPNGYFDNYEAPVQMHAWKDLVQALAEHLMDRYGREEILTWYFETWNEPNISFWKQSHEDFICYYDACSEGLKAADPEITFGGPGTAGWSSDTFKDLLRHCESGTNRITGETGSRIDYISFHEKGGHAKHGQKPNPILIQEHETSAIEYIRENHPDLAEVPVMNNECDPVVGWGRDADWRAWPYYPAIIAKIINQHQRGLIENMHAPFTLLSNDNGFVGNWYQRTLAAQLGTDDPEAYQFDMIRQGGLSIMSLLTLVGNHNGDFDIPLREPSWFYNIGGNATRRGDDQFALLLYNCLDNPYTKGKTPVKVKIKGLPEETLRLATYRIDAGHTNPYGIWTAQGKPEQPTPAQLAEMRRHEEPELFEEPRDIQAEGGQMEWEMDLPAPSVTLYLFNRDPGHGPEAPAELKIEEYTGLNGDRQNLLSWEGVDSRLIRTYEVFYSASRNGPYLNITDADRISTAFLHAQAPDKGYYKVRTVDYWGRTSDFCDPVKIR